MTAKQLELLEYDRTDGAPAGNVGGKAFNLARCRRAGIRVPDGVVLPLEAHQASQGGETLDTLFQALADRFAGSEMLIVRSSSPGEDGSSVSYAGQFASVACRAEPAAIRDACQKVWASAESDAAAAYLAAAGREAAGPPDKGMPLLIQRLVAATASGVCFTRDPRQNREQVQVINAVHGLGSALADDEVAADHYEVDAADGTVSVLRKGQQGSWREADDPWSLVPLPPGLAGRPALEEKQVLEVAGLAREAAAAFGQPLDVEWAYQGNELHLLQARPITTPADGGAYTSWTRDNAAEVIPGAVTPLSWSILEPAVNGGFQRALALLGLPRRKDPLFALFHSRVYFNSTLYAGLVAAPGGGRPSMAARLSKGRGYLRCLTRHRMDTARLEARFARRLRQNLGGTARTALKALARLLRRYMEIHLRIAVLMDLGLAILRSLVGRHRSGPEANRLIDGLFTGSNQLESCEPADALRGLAEQIRKDDHLAQEVLSAEPLEVPGVLGGGGPQINGLWRRLIDRFGDSAEEEFELLHPRWRDRPDFLSRMLQNYLEECPRRSPEQLQAERADRRAAAEKDFHGLFPLPARPLLRLLVNHLRRCSQLREACKQRLVRIMAALRRQAIRLAEEGSLEPPEAVFFLTLPELLRAAGGPAALEAARAGELKEDWLQAGLEEPWEEIRVYPDGRQERIPRQAGQGPKLTGLSLSSGAHSGTARIVLDPREAGSFKAGDVLVARATNSSWTPLFTLAGAVVTDRGNYLSHGAIVCRELGLPAVGNLGDATERIRDGQRITVDGDRGLVLFSQEDH